MNLNMSELDNPNNNYTYDPYSFENKETNYWEKPNELATKKKKVSFDDILSNMNLVVNEKGVLQYMLPAQTMDQNLVQNPAQNFVQNPVQVQPPAPIDPSVKHSYIYNKYFKDYHDPNAQSNNAPRVPKTMAEYRKMIIEDKIKAIQQKMRVEQIKSKKMMFTTVPGATSNPRSIQATKNTLRSMNFR